MLVFVAAIMLLLSLLSVAHLFVVMLYAVHLVRTDPILVLAASCSLIAWVFHRVHVVLKVAK